MTDAAQQATARTHLDLLRARERLRRVLDQAGLAVTVIADQRGVFTVRIDDRLGVRVALELIKEEKENSP
jgi:hypothetical protein